MLATEITDQRIIGRIQKELEKRQTIQVQKNRKAYLACWENKVSEGCTYLCTLESQDRTNLRSDMLNNG